MSDSYTRYPRTTLWLLPEVEAFPVGGRADEPSTRFVADVPALYVGKSVITNEQYEAFDPTHERSALSCGDDEPVTRVSFHDAVSYCEWYARVSRKAFRLPTEAEWERACRVEPGGGPPWGDDPERARDFAWGLESAGGRAREIETLRANGAGLHDTLGLVWEWTAGRDRARPTEADVAAGERVVRGGSFLTPEAELSCLARLSLPEDARRDDVGFRIVREL